MKKLLTVVFAVLITASLSIAQTGGDKNALNPQPLPPGKKTTTTATPEALTVKQKTKKKKKSGKKTKKGSGSTTPK